MNYHLVHSRRLLQYIKRTKFNSAISQLQSTQYHFDVIYASQQLLNIILLISKIKLNCVEQLF